MTFPVSSAWRGCFYLAIALGLFAAGYGVAAQAAEVASRIRRHAANIM